MTDSPASLGTEMLAFAAGAKVNPLNERKQRPENLFTAAVETKIEFEEVKEPQSYSAGLLDKVKKLFSKQEKNEQKSAESFSEQEQAILDIATETANQGQTVSKLENDFNTLNTAHEQLQKDFNDLKQKLDGEPESSPRPTSGNSQFSEVVDC